MTQRRHYTAPSLTRLDVLTAHPLLAISVTDEDTSDSDKTQGRRPDPTTSPSGFGHQKLWED